MSVYARVYMIKIHTVMVKPVACGCPEDRLHFTMKIAVDSNPWNKLLGPKLPIHRTTSPHSQLYGPSDTRPNKPR